MADLFDITTAEEREHPERPAKKNSESETQTSKEKPLDPLHPSRLETPDVVLAEPVDPNSPDINREVFYPEDEYDPANEYKSPLNDY